MFDIKQIEFQRLKSLKKVDLILIAVGYESRASYLAEQLADTQFRRKYCIKLVDNCNKAELKRIQQLGFQFVNNKEIESIFDEFYETVVIDYSVMMKSMYAELLEKVLNGEAYRNTKTFFSYTHSLFEPWTTSGQSVESIKPILLTEDKEIFGLKNTKIIISLGYERLSAIGLIENLEISYEDVYVLINKQNEQSPHYFECKKVNEDFLNLIKEDQILELDFYNLNQIITVLDSIFHKLKIDNNQVIIAPMSVKTFSLFSMVHSLKYSHVIFYNVTSSNSTKSYTKLPNTNKEPLVYELSSIQF